MGAEYVERTFSGKLTESQLLKAFKDAQDDAGYENGNSYSGDINMCDGLTITNKVFQNETEADAYLNETAKKWGPAIAVKVLRRVNAQPDAKLSELNTTLRDLNNSYFNLEAEIKDKTIAKLKSVEFISCQCCKSRLETRFASNRITRCLVCNADFRAKSELKKLESIKAKADALTKKIFEYRGKLNDKANKNSKEYDWLIAGVCSS